MSLLGLGFRRPECLAEEAGYKVQVLGFHRGLQYCIESMCARNSESLNYELGLFLSRNPTMMDLGCRIECRLEDPKHELLSATLFCFGGRGLQA